MCIKDELLEEKHRGKGKEKLCASHENNI